jgi:hypothetical protein
LIFGQLSLVPKEPHPRQRGFQLSWLYHSTIPGRKV